MNKAKVAIIGTGNIGCDLLAKVMRSELLEPTLFAGRNMLSSGSQWAALQGIHVSEEGIGSIMEDPSCCDIVFDATTAESHKTHAPILKELGKFVIDLTPSKIGKMCIPSLNNEVCLTAPNINLITCGGQATIPMIETIMDIHPDIEYVEVVASISSKSAGPGTRANIDEFTQTTKEAIELFTGVKKAKAIIILNPAEPPIMMHNTIYFKVKNPDISRIEHDILQCEEDIQMYVPGYHITCGPIYENGRLTIMIEVVGLGDFLPEYSGNLDIITCAAVTMAEKYVLAKGMKLDKQWWMKKEESNNA